MKPRSSDLHKSWCCTIWAYRARIIADKQERPARVVATLKRGEGHNKEVVRMAQVTSPKCPLRIARGRDRRLAQRVSRPPDALGSNAKKRSAYWQGHVVLHRPSGAANASLTLRQSLIDIITRFSPDDPSDSERQKRKNRHNRDRWVATAAKAIGAKYPDEKKNRGAIHRRANGQHAEADHEAA